MPLKQFLHNILANPFPCILLTYSIFTTWFIFRLVCRESRVKLESRIRELEKERDRLQDHIQWLEHRYLPSLERELIKDPESLSDIYPPSRFDSEGKIVNINPPISPPTNEGPRND